MSTFKDLIGKFLSIDFDTDSKLKYTTNGITLEPQKCLENVWDVVTRSIFPKFQSQRTQQTV